MDKLICSFKLATNMVRNLVCDAGRPVIVKVDLVGLCIDGNWEIWVRGCDSKIVSICAIREGAVGFLQS